MLHSMKTMNMAVVRSISAFQMELEDKDVSRALD